MPEDIEMIASMCVVSARRSRSRAMAVAIFICGLQPLYAEDQVVASENHAAPICQEKVDAVVELITKMPDWPLLPFDKKGEGVKEAELEAIQIAIACRRISQYDTPTIRAAYAEIIRDQETSTNYKFLWLNRFLFKSPRTSAINSEAYSHLNCGGWRVKRLWNSDSDEKQYDLHYPWKNLSDTPSFQVDRSGYAYSGPRYQALIVFDFCAENYERREYEVLVKP